MDFVITTEYQRILVCFTQLSLLTCCYSSCMFVTKLFSTWLVRHRSSLGWAVEVAVCSRHGSTQGYGASRPRNPEALLRPTPNLNISAGRIERERNKNTRARIAAKKKRERQRAGGRKPGPPQASVALLSTLSASSSLVFPQPQMAALRLQYEYYSYVGVGVTKG